MNELISCSDFIKKSLIALCAVVLFEGTTDFRYAFASTDFVYGGAAGLSKEAIQTIENGISAKSFEMTIGEEPIEAPVPKDLSGNFLPGISYGNIDLSGKTYDQAMSEINSYISNISNGKIVFNVADGNSVDVTAGQIGLAWNDKDSIEDALLLGRDGNILTKYKARKDLEHEKKSYPIQLDYDKDIIRVIVEEQGELYNVEAVDATMSRADGDFTIVPGIVGRKIDVDKSVNKILAELKNYDGSDMVIDLEVREEEPKGRTEDLEKVHDIIGSYKTSFSSSSSDRSGNVRNGASKIDGRLMYPGDSFSMYETVSPFTEENGYYLAGSYSNGMVVESFGGGICQVSSTLYNAVLRAELQVDERYNHSMVVTYVDLSSDAAISGTSKDFKFTNNKDFPIYIEAMTTSDKQVIFNIYGVETRPSNRKVTYESVKISETIPDTEKIVADPSLPLGTVKVQSPHTGYVGELWKVVTVDGVETERTQVNKSTYHPSPKTASVGVATDNPAALSIVQAAIGSGSIDYVKSVVSGLNAAASAAVGQ